MLKKYKLINYLILMFSISTNTVELQAMKWNVVIVSPYLIILDNFSLKSIKHAVYLISIIPECWAQAVNTSSNDNVPLNPFKFTEDGWRQVSTTVCMLYLYVCRQGMMAP